MVKTLRFSLLAIVAMVCNVAFADAYKTLKFPAQGGEKINGYTDAWTATQGTDTWTIANFNTYQNGWTYIKCGRRNNASVASIATDFAMDKAIGNVMVSVDKILATDKVKSINLVVASDAAFNTVVATVPASSIEAGDMQFKVAEPKAGLYYKLVFDCAGHSANGIIQISKVQYFEEGNEPEIVDISNTLETAYNVAKAHELTAAGEGLATKVYVKGVITNIKEVALQYGNAEFTINDADAAGEGMVVFRCNWFDGAKFTSENQIKVGDEIIVYGKLDVYNGAHQITSGQVAMLNGSTTAIENVEVANDGKQAIYTIGGQQLEKAQKGLNIINGKKVIVK
ncbi:hypothetical protein HPS57_11995 [Prevotella sp. PINT]|jgi:RecG-like helicase|uniref:hypothetical protein n=1 Tax=Palleniella intestinalis TaxID=2736291 RepID=UPI001555C168|nr:hypothetical protein [Palleniella intestinalis]NPD82687.1 hypothetical protein [Palleniella intestinalis]